MNACNPTSIPEIRAKHEAGARALADALNAAAFTIEQMSWALRKAFGRIGRQTIEVFWVVDAEVMTGLYGHNWLRAHPGRRLPGSLRNRRLAKKRAQYLERWAREVGLA